MNKQFKPGEAVIIDAGLGITKQGNIQRITETLAYVKHYNGSVVGYRYEHIKPATMTEQKRGVYGAGLSNEYSMIQQILEKNSSVKVNHFGEMGEAIVEDLEPAQMTHYMSVITKNSTFTPPLSEKKLTPAELKKREEVAKAMERENPGMDMSKKMAIATATAKKVAEEAEQVDEAQFNALKHIKNPSSAVKAAAKDVKRSSYADRAALMKAGGVKDDRGPRGVTQEDTHYCAKHVFSERFGEGLVVEGSHAEPSTEGLIEWYDVDFGGTVRRVMTEKVKVMHAEYHMNHKKKMKEEDEIEEASQQASTTMKHVQDPTPGEKKAAKDIKPGIAGYRDRIAMLKSAQAAGRLKEGKAHTVPKTDKEKDLAAIAPPHDKITHADVMTGRGVKKEEADQIDELNKDTLISYQDKADADITRKHRVLGPQIKAGDAKAANKTSNTIGKRMAGIDRAVERLNKEEVELDEGIFDSLKKGYTNGLKTGLKQKIKPEHHKSYNIDDVKSTSDATSILQKAKQAGHAVNEEVELDELSKGTLRAYINKAGTQVLGAAAAANSGMKFDDKQKAKLMKRGDAVDTAVDKFKAKKEEVELDEAMISYSDFQDKIKSHQKAGNQIKDDKYDKKKASYTVIDQEGTAKKITHTDSGVSQQHLGSVKRDDSDDKSSETKPKETRGRGRPAGSKSGARN